MLFPSAEYLGRIDVCHNIDITTCMTAINQQQMFCVERSYGKLCNLTAEPLIILTCRLTMSRTYIGAHRYSSSRHESLKRHALAIVCGLRLCIACFCIPWITNLGHHLSREHTHMTLGKSLMIALALIATVLSKLSIETPKHFWTMKSWLTHRCISRSSYTSENALNKLKHLPMTVWTVIPGAYQFAYAIFLTFKSAEQAVPILPIQMLRLLNL